MTSARIASLEVSSKCSNQTVVQSDELTGCLKEASGTRGKPCLVESVIWYRGKLVKPHPFSWKVGSKSHPLFQGLNLGLGTCKASVFTWWLIPQAPSCILSQDLSLADDPAPENHLSIFAQGTHLDWPNNLPWASTEKKKVPLCLLPRTLGTNHIQASPPPAMCVCV